MDLKYCKLVEKLLSIKVKQNCFKEHGGKTEKVRDLTEVSRLDVNMLLVLIILVVIRFLLYYFDCFRINRTLELTVVVVPVISSVNRAGW